MRVIILGYKNCPHCRALLRLLREAKDITSVAYVEFNTFIESYLSESDKQQYMKKLHSSSIPLPYVLYNNGEEKWKELNLSQFTKSVLESYIKSIKNGK